MCIILIRRWKVIGVASGWRGAINRLVGFVGGGKRNIVFLFKESCRRKMREERKRKHESFSKLGLRSVVLYKASLYRGFVLVAKVIIFD